MLNGRAQVCSDLSPDMSAGVCRIICNPFTQDCPSGMDGCFVVQADGTGTCSLAQGQPGACSYVNSCDPGLQCQMNSCRRFCGGPNNVPCANMKTCMDLSPTVSKKVVGLCSG